MFLRVEPPNLRTGQFIVRATLLEKEPLTEGLHLASIENLCSSHSRQYAFHVLGVM